MENLYISENITFLIHQTLYSNFLQRKIYHEKKVSVGLYRWLIPPRKKRPESYALGSNEMKV